jgi:hypothetical protein
MARRLPLFVLLASALVFLASLYLPWQEVSHAGNANGGEVGVLGLLDLFSGGNSDGWTTQAGVVASLAALLLVAAAAVALVRRDAVSRLVPLFPFALAVLYLAIADLVALHAEEALLESFQSNRGAQYHYAYGAYLSVAAAAMAVLAAAFLERARHARRPSSVEVIALLLGAGLLVAFLLPWETAGGSKAISFPGVNGPPVVLAAVAVCLLLDALLRSRNAVYVAGVIAVLVGATVNEVTSGPRIDYGAWTALGLAVALVVATAFLRRPTRLAIPSLSGALAATAAAVYVIALFLPWREFCAPGGQTLGSGLGRCYATTGWGAGESSAAAGTLALVVILAAVVLAWSAASTAELTLAIAIFTAVAGVTVESLGGNMGAAGAPATARTSASPRLGSSYSSGSSGSACPGSEPDV